MNNLIRCKTWDKNQTRRSCSETPRTETKKHFCCLLDRVDISPFAVHHIVMSMLPFMIRTGPVNINCVECALPKCSFHP